MSDNNNTSSNHTNTSTRTTSKNNNNSNSVQFQPIHPFVSILIINVLYLAYPKTTISAIVFVIEASSITNKTESIDLFSIFNFLTQKINIFFSLFWLEKIVIFGVILITNLINTSCKKIDLRLSV